MNINSQYGVCADESKDTPKNEFHVYDSYVQILMNVVAIRVSLVVTVQI